MSEAPRRLRGIAAELLSPAACGLLGALLFAPAVGSGRLADDFVLLRTVRQVTDVLWPFGRNDLGQAPGSGHFYRPVWVLWNAATYELSHNPLAAHLLNLVLFGIICAEVVLVLRAVLDRATALIGGLLFATFPSHGESVAWISGNTDLLAVALGLAAILIALRAKPTVGRDLTLVVVTALAMLAKEIAAVIPALAAILLWMQPAASGERRSWNRGRPVVVMLAAVLIVLVARSAVIHGLGGYGQNPFTLKRVAGSLVSFSVAGLSGPQLQLLRYPALLLVPVGLLALIALGLYRAWRARDRRGLTTVILGMAWFVVALLPVLNQPLNLNTRNGDRLLLLPSVGLVLAAAALISRTRDRTRMAVCAILMVLGAASCIFDATDWNTAGNESRRLLADIARLAPVNTHLIALSVPSDYRAAHLYPDALDVAVQESGRPDLTLTPCIPVHVVQLRPGQVSFRSAGGSWIGVSTQAAPFDVPVLGSSQAGTGNGCAFRKPQGAPASSLGTSLRAIVTPTLTPEPQTRYIYFDGIDIRAQPR